MICKYEKDKEFFPDINVSDFDFKMITMEGVKKENLNMNIEKSYSSDSIPATTSKQSLYFYLP